MTEKIYHIGDCPVCKGYGRMELIYYISADKISAICEECLLEFDSVSDYIKIQNGHRDSYTNTTPPPVRYAAIEEIKRSEWYPYVTDKL